MVFAPLVSTHAQHKPFYKGKFRKPGRFTRQKARVACPVFEDSGYPYNGIGIKLGDPFALTYKLYFTKNLAMSVDFGKGASGLYSGYFRDQFETYTEGLDSLLDPGEGFSYLNHKVKSNWTGEVRMMYQTSLDAWVKGLQAYIGLGVEWRHTEIKYEYIWQKGRNENEILHFDETRYALGPTGTVGLEYSYFELPIAAFIEVAGFADISEDPGYIRPQGGVGIRWVF
ncbi:hypothetical protein [Fulvivirga sediminis]|uniref:Uncharacterized protein n=1 Tax=Fulvivirga sediminis TaxID=2803949 RepID=A0A937F2L5_9BACT|nr:hypothetical protein [Fulvivirga sediminis]MBL3654575.1 hypothetical protein [Fulvivirga sediminis]